MVAGKRLFMHILARDEKAFRESVHQFDYIWPRLAMEQTIEIAKFIRKSAKLRAPRWTGRLADSIDYTIVSSNRVEISATRAYAGYQEFGYAPHFVSAHKHPHLKEWAEFKGYRIKNYYLVSKHKPFMYPAYRAAMGRLESFYGPSIKQAIKRSFKSMHDV